MEAHLMGVGATLVLGCLKFEAKRSVSEPTSALKTHREWTWSLVLPCRHKRPNTTADHCAYAMHIRYWDPLKSRSSASMHSLVLIWDCEASATTPLTAQHESHPGVVPIHPNLWTALLT